MNPYQSLRDYEEFVYNLPQQFLSIVSSTLVVVRRGARMVTFPAGNATGRVKTRAEAKRRRGLSLASGSLATSPGE